MTLGVHGVGTTSDGFDRRSSATQTPATLGRMRPNRCGQNHISAKNLRVKILDFGGLLRPGY
jgi:hypothetical protein